MTSSPGTRTGKRTWTGWAGKALDNAPPAKEEDVLGADTTKFVYVPLDVAMRYRARARRTSASLPYASRLAWLQQRDTKERADWVSRFRESNLTLGQVIKATYEARDAHWVPTGHLLSAPTGVTCQASGEGGQTPAGKADRRESGRARHEGWHRAMPSFPTWAMQGGAVMPQRPAQVRCDPLDCTKSREICRTFAGPPMSQTAAF